MTSSVKKIRPGDVRVVGEVSPQLAWGFAFRPKVIKVLAFFDDPGFQWDR